MLYFSKGHHKLFWAISAVSSLNLVWTHQVTVGLSSLGLTLVLNDKK